MGIIKIKDLEMAQQMYRTAKRQLYREERGPCFAKDTPCKYWLKGRCTRNPCQFKHSDPTKKLAAGKPETEQIVQPIEQNALSARRDYIKCETKEEIIQPVPKSKQYKRTPETEQIVQPIKQKALPARRDYIKPEAKEEIIKPGPKTKQCKGWVTNSCVLGERCQNVHSWFSGSGFQMLAKLEGHNKAVTGIVLPSGSDKLYSVSEDRSIRVWDCNSGQCVRKYDTNCDVGCIITKGPWLFFGLTNSVKGWDFIDKTEYILEAQAGLVCSIDVDDEKLYAGMEDGTIFVWKKKAEMVTPEHAAVLNAHTGAVNSVLVGPSCMLYSGSKDGTIKQWNRQNLQCVQTLCGHTADVSSLVCWDKFLLSASLDKTIKVWECGENGKLEHVYERTEDDGVLVLCIIHNSEKKPILLCSCLGNSVRLYDIPTFNERGRIFSKGEVHTITEADKLFFTGDASGEVSAWHVL